MRSPASEPLPSGYRLCLVSDSVELGGAERFLSYLAAALPPQVEVHLLATSSQVAAAVAPHRVRSTVVPALGLRTARRVLREVRPDVVHANLIAFPSCRSAVLAALSLRIPVVLVDHLPTPGLTWRGRAVQRAMTARCAARVALGEGAKALVAAYGGIPVTRLTSIPNGVPHRALPARSRAARTQPVLGALCRLEPQKGVDVLLQVLARLPGVRLDVAGDGSQRRALEELAARLGVGDRVRFLGWVQDVPSLFAGIDVLVVPSREEAMPLAVLEAMHASLPVVATRVGSLPEVVVDRGTGLIVPPEDVDALTGACRELLEDRALRERYGAAAAVRAARDHTDTAMATAYDRLYRSVLVRRRPVAERGRTGGRR